MSTRFNQPIDQAPPSKKCRLTPLNEYYDEDLLPPSISNKIIPIPPIKRETKQTVIELLAPYKQKLVSNSPQNIQIHHPRISVIKSKNETKSISGNTKQQQPITIYDIPNQCWSLTFQFLDVNNLVFKVAKYNKFFQSLIVDQSTWIHRNIILPTKIYKINITKSDENTLEQIFLNWTTLKQLDIMLEPDVLPSRVSYMWRLICTPCPRITILRVGNSIQLPGGDQCCVNQEAFEYLKLIKGIQVLDFSFNMFAIPYDSIIDFFAKQAGLSYNAPPKTNKKYIRYTKWKKTKIQNNNNNNNNNNSNKNDVDPVTSLNVKNGETTFFTDKDNDKDQINTCIDDNDLISTEIVSSESDFFNSDSNIPHKRPDSIKDILGIGDNASDHDNNNKGESLTYSDINNNSDIDLQIIQTPPPPPSKTCNKSLLNSAPATIRSNSILRKRRTRRRKRKLKDLDHHIEIDDDKCSNNNNNTSSSKQEMDSDDNNDDDDDLFSTPQPQSKSKSKSSTVDAYHTFPHKRKGSRIFVFKCSYCNLKKHIRIHTNELNENTKKKAYKCLNCSKTPQNRSKCFQNKRRKGRNRIRKHGLSSSPSHYNIKMKNLRNKNNKIKSPLKSIKKHNNNNNNDNIVENEVNILQNEQIRREKEKTITKVVNIPFSFDTLSSTPSPIASPSSAVTGCNNNNNNKSISPSLISTLRDLNNSELELNLSINLNNNSTADVFDSTLLFSSSNNNYSTSMYRQYLYNDYQHISRKKLVIKMSNNLGFKSSLRRIYFRELCQKSFPDLAYNYLNKDIIASLSLFIGDSSSLCAFIDNLNKYNACKSIKKIEIDGISPFRCRSAPLCESLKKCVNLCSIQLPCIVDAIDIIAFDSLLSSSINLTEIGLVNGDRQLFKPIHDVMAKYGFKMDINPKRLMFIFARKKIKTTKNI